MKAESRRFTALLCAFCMLFTSIPSSVMSDSLTEEIQAATATPTDLQPVETEETITPSETEDEVPQDEAPEQPQADKELKAGDDLTVTGELTETKKESLIRFSPEKNQTMVLVLTADKELKATVQNENTGDREPFEKDHTDEDGTTTWIVADYKTEKENTYLLRISGEEPAEFTLRLVRKSLFEQEQETEEPAGEPTDETGDEPAAQSADEPGEETGEAADEEPGEESGEQITEETAEEPAETPDGQTVGETTDKTTDDTTEETDQQETLETTKDENADEPEEKEKPAADREITAGNDVTVNGEMNSSGEYLIRFTPDMDLTLYLILTAENAQATVTDEQTDSTKQFTQDNTVEEEQTVLTVPFYKIKNSNSYLIRISGTGEFTVRLVRSSILKAEANRQDEPEEATDPETDPEEAPAENLAEEPEEKQTEETKESLTEESEEIQTEEPEEISTEELEDNPTEETEENPAETELEETEENPAEESAEESAAEPEEIPEEPEIEPETAPGMTEEPEAEPEQAEEETSETPAAQAESEAAEETETPATLTDLEPVHEEMPASQTDLEPVEEEPVEVRIDATDSAIEAYILFLSNAGIPERTELQVRELTPEEQEAYQAQTAQALNAEDESYLRYTKYLEFTLVHDGWAIPLNAPAKVYVTLPDINEGADALQVVRFDNMTPVLLDSERTENTVSFETEGFDVFGIGNALVPVTDHETELVKVEVLSFAEDAPVNLAEAEAPEVIEGLEVLGTFTIEDNTEATPEAKTQDGLFIKAELKEDAELDPMEGVALYSVDEDGNTEILMEQLTEDAKITELEATQVAVIKDTGYRHLTLTVNPDETTDDQIVTLDGMMPKESEAIVEDVTIAHAEANSMELSEENYAAENNTTKASDKSETEGRIDIDNKKRETAITTEKLTKDTPEPEGTNKEIIETESKEKLIVAYDLTILNGEEAYQPDEDKPIEVEIIDSRITVEKNNIQLWHIKDDGTKEQVEEFTVTEGRIAFTAYGFSTYAVTYTVDFYYGEYEFHLEGGEEMLLSELLDILQIDADLTGSSVGFTNPDVLQFIPEKSGNEEIIDWTIRSIEPFVTEETLTITLANETIIELRVTDKLDVNISYNLALTAERGGEILLDQNGQEALDGDNQIFIWRVPEGSTASDHAYTFRVSYHIDTETSIDHWVPGQIEIRLPEHVLEGDEDRISLPIPEAGDPKLENDTSTIFEYTIVSNPETGKNEIVIRNRLPVDTSSAAQIEFSYITTKKTYEYPDEETLGHLNATFCVYDMDPAAAVVNTSAKILEDVVSNGYSLQMDTGSSIVNTNSIKTTKEFAKKATTWDTAWSAIAPDNAGDYWYYQWDVKSTIHSSQYFDYSIVDTPLIGEVVGYKMSDDVNFVFAADPNAGTKKNINPGTGTITRTDYVITRLLIADFEDLYEEGFLIKNNVVATVTPTSEHDKNNPTSNQADTSYLDKEKTFQNAEPSIQGSKKGMSTSYSLTNLKSSSVSEVYNLDYSVEISGNNSWTWTYLGENAGITATEAEVDCFGLTPINYKIDDKTFYFRYFDYDSLTDAQKAKITQAIINSHMNDWTWEENGSLRKNLNADEYRIDSIEVDYSFRDARDEDNDILYGNKEFSAVALDAHGIYQRTQQASGVLIPGSEGSYKPRLGDLVFKLYSGNTLEYTVNCSFTDLGIEISTIEPALLNTDFITLTDKKLYFDSSLNITGFDLINENALYQTTITAKPSITLKRTDNNGLGKLLDVINDQQVEEKYQLITLVNSADMSMAVGDQAKTVTRTAKDDIIPDTRTTKLKKDLLGRENDIFNQVFTMNWRVTLQEDQTIAGISQPVPQNGGTFYEYLPYEQDYIPNSLAVYADGVKLNKGEYSFMIDPNKYLHGREKFIVTITKPAEKNYSITYQTELTWDALIEQRNGSEDIYAHNAVVYLTENESIANANVTHRNSDGHTHWSQANKNPVDVDNDMEWSDGKLDPAIEGGWQGLEKRLIGISAEYKIEAEVLGELDLHKSVKAVDVGGSYSSEEVVYARDEYSAGEDEYVYRITFGPVVGTKTHDMIMYDFLEAYKLNSGDEYAWHGTLKNVDTSVLARLGVDPIVYYSTLDRSVLANLLADPNRKDTENDIRNLGAKDDNGDDIWTRASNVSDIEDVTAVAVDMSQARGGGSFVLTGGQMVTIKIYMKAPSPENGEDDTAVYNEAHMSLKQIPFSNDIDENDRKSYLSNAYTAVWLRMKGRLRIHKINSETGENAPDIIFTLKGISAFGTEVDEMMTSGENGMLAFSRLEKTADNAPYELQEQPGNPDYHYKEDILYVWVDDDGIVKLSKNKTEPEDFDSDLPQYIEYISKDDVYEIKNTPRVHGALEFIKLDRLTGEPVSGVVYSLTGTSYYNKEIELTAVSEQDGVVSFPDIERGENYQLKEINAPDGYAVANRTFLVTCNDYGVVTMIMDGEADNNKDNVEFIIDQEGAYVVKDEPAFDLGLYKSDAFNGQSLSGAVFHLTGYTSHGDPVDMRATSQLDSSVLFRNLEAGSYVMTEETPPAKHVVDGFEYNVTVESSGKITISWDEESMTNEVIDPDSGAPVYVGLSGFGEDSEEDQRRYGERFFYSYYGRFNIPNDRTEDGIVVIEKVWLDANGNNITDTQNMVSPIVNLDSMEVDAPKVAAMIDYDFEWRDPNRVYSGRYCTDFINVYGYPVTFGPLPQSMESEPIDSSWVQVGVCNDDYPGKVYVKRDSTGNVYWRPGPNVGKVYLPENCQNLFTIVNKGDNNITTSVNLTGLYADKTKKMQSVFKDCKKLTSIVFPEYFNTSQVDNFQQMFANAVALKTLNLTSFDTSHATTFSQMFNGCSGLTELDLSSFSINSLLASNGLYNMFNGCTALVTIFASNNWSDNNNAKNSSGVFANCKKLKGWHGATYSSPTTVVTGSRANYTENSGLFTHGGSCTEPKQYSSSSSASGNVQPRENNIRKTTNDIKIESSEWENGEYTGTETNKWIRRPDGHWIYRMTVYDENTTFYVSEDTLDANNVAYLAPYNFNSLQVRNSETGEFDSILQGGALQYTAETNGHVLVKNKRETSSSTPSTGSIVITKEVIGAVRASEAFSFTAEYGNAFSKSMTFTIKNGESKKISGLSGAVRITEGLNNNYKTTMTVGSEEPQETNTVTATIVRGGQVQVLVSNTSKSGELDIQKIVDKTGEDIEDPDPDDRYVFTVRLWTVEEGTEVKTPLTGSYGGYSFLATAVNGESVGEATINLKHNQTVKLKNLPAEACYSVTESQRDHFTTAITKTVGPDSPENISIGAGEPATVTGAITPGVTDLVVFTNTKIDNDPSTGFKLQKTVDGRKTDKSFNFSIRLWGLMPGEIYHYTVETTSEVEGTSVTVESKSDFTADGNGEYLLSNIYLASNQTISFTGLPVGAQYNITEQANEYIASYEIVSKIFENAVPGSSRAENGAIQRSLSTNRRTLTINGMEDTITFTNTEPTFNLAIRKENPKSQTIAGANLELHELSILDVITEQNEEKELAVYTDIAYSRISTTSAWVLKLYSGSYILKEIEAPAGYAKSLDIRIEIDENGSAQWWKVSAEENGKDTEDRTIYKIKAEGSVKNGNVQMVDEPYEIRVYKTEMDGTTPVFNASLRIVEEVENGDDIIVDRWTTGYVSHLVSGGLNLNTEYKLIEYRAPEGYLKAEPITFMLVDTNESPFYKLQIKENGKYADADDLIIYMQDISQISFSKRWYHSMRDENMVWPDGATIEVQVSRTMTPVNAYDHSETGDPSITEDNWATFSIDQSAATRNAEIVSSNNADAKLISSRMANGEYLFAVTGAMKYGIDGETLYRYDYNFKETSDPLPGYYDPKHLYYGTIYDNNKWTREGGLISNETVIPAPTGYGSRKMPFVMLLIFSIAILTIGGIGFSANRKKKRIPDTGPAKASVQSHKQWVEYRTPLVRGAPPSVPPCPRTDLWVKPTGSTGKRGDPGL